MTWRMPIEGAPHSSTWLAWPTAYTAHAATDPEGAYLTWAAVANAVAAFEPVTVAVDPVDRSLARQYLDPAVEVFEVPLDDAWMRDVGPTFVLDTESGMLGAVDWVFNGWGGQAPEFARDAAVASAVAEAAGAVRIPSPLVNEGGGMHVDGVGTVLLTETVQLGRGRNPTWTRAQVEAELARTIGAERVVWMPRGLTRDYDELGTLGHVDIVATMPEPGRALVHDQRDAAHPDHAVSTEAAGILSRSGLDVTLLPAPHTLRDRHGFVDWSYVNHLVVNGGVIACTFDDPHDADALAILGEAYPGREVVGVDARELFARGGGIHCITQQVPATA